MKNVRTYNGTLSSDCLTRVCILETTRPSDGTPQTYVTTSHKSRWNGAITLSTLDTETGKTRSATIKTYAEACDAILLWIGVDLRERVTVSDAVVGFELRSSESEVLKLGTKMREIPLREGDREPASEPCECGAPRSPGLGCCWKCYDRIAAKSDGEWRDGRRV